MKLALPVLALLTLTLSAQTPSVPRKASDIGIQIGTEKYLWLSEYTGKTCIVAAIMTTCSHCQFTVGVLNKIQKDYGDKGVQVIATAIEPMSSLHIAAFEKQFAPQFPVGYSEQGYVQKFLGHPENDPMLVPQVVFVDKNGIIRAQLSGEDASMNKDIQEKTLRDTLEKTLKDGLGPAVAPAKPRPASK